MFDKIFKNPQLFEPFGFEHGLIVLVGSIIGVIIILLGKRASEKNQRLIPLSIAVFISFIQLLVVAVYAFQGRLNIQEDLPFHLCNMMSFFLIYCFATRSSSVWKVVFFWIMVGCSQSNITPTIQASFPHYTNLIYFIEHIGIVILALYPIFVWKWSIGFKDILISLLWLNVLAAVIFGLNSLLGSNYMYLMHKPHAASLFDVLGPWPYYILVCEFAFILMTVPVVFIYMFFTKKSLKSSS